MIDLISRKSMSVLASLTGLRDEANVIRRLSGKSRIEFTTGRLTTMVSADSSFLVSRYHNCCALFAERA